MNRFIIAALAASFSFIPAFAKDAPAPELNKYTRTGEYKTCLTNNRIKEMQILNHRQILVKMNGNQAYLGEVSHCSQLSKGLTLSYDVAVNEFCTTTIIHLLDLGTPVPERGSCGIDRFEKLEKKK